MVYLLCSWFDTLLQWELIKMKPDKVCLVLPLDVNDKYVCLSKDPNKHTCLYISSYSFCYHPDRDSLPTEGKLPVHYSRQSDNIVPSSNREEELE